MPIKIGAPPKPPRAPPLGEAAALAEIRTRASANRIHYSDHAEQRMGSRRIKGRDVYRALLDATACRWQPEEGTYRATGLDVAGEKLDVALRLAPDGTVWVVTVF